MLRREQKGRLRDETLESSEPMTPPTEYIRRKRLDDDDEDSIPESFFLRPYVPLSNLPTPPPSARASPEVEVEDRDEFLAPALYLQSQLPSSSLDLIQQILSRAALPQEIVALGIRILQSYQSHNNIPLSADPELLILTSLILALKYLDDFAQSTCVYRSWAGERWSCERICEVERGVLMGVGWGICALWRDGEGIEEVVDAMNGGGDVNGGLRVHIEKGGGKAVAGLGMMMTPAETPSEELEMVFEESPELVYERICL